MSRGHPITAYAACNGLGRTTESVLEGLFAGRRGLVVCPEKYEVETWVGQVSGEDGAGQLPPMIDEVARWDSRQGRMTQLVALQIRDATRAAMARWGAERVGIVVGTSTAGIAASELAWAHHARVAELPEGFRFDRQHGLHATSTVLQQIMGSRGPTYVVSTACSSSGRVFACATRLIDAGICDAVLVGGVDTLCKLTLRGFSSLEVTSSEPCRPFSTERKGISIGEGGALLLVERDAEPGTEHARVLGIGETSDAHHMTSPHPEGRGAREAMEMALSRAGLTAEDVDQINVHGTGTQHNDRTEGRAVFDLLGTDRVGEVAVCATKGYTGHMLGAAGATEAIFSIASMERGIVPASLGCDPIDDEIGVYISSQAIERPTRRVLSNSLAFGGSNVSVLLERGGGS
jgi:3-oxoacyl-[acyl-carrier-protein] synthase-1